jgi:acid phosphatase family membrane protein YuiD
MFSPYVIAILVSWITAQGFKVALASAGRREAFHKKMLYSSGSMPSAHSAAAVALATTIGMRDGWDSAVFGIAFLFAGVVMYDAIMVRRSSGEQGSAIGSIIKELKSKIIPPRTAKGHEPVEVLVGAIIGVVVGILVFTFTK